MPFSTRLHELNKKNVKPTSSTSTSSKKLHGREIADIVPAINSCAAADDTVLGHAFFEETKACAALAAAADAGYKQQLVREKPGIMWPCWTVRDAATNTDDLVPASPIKFGLVLDQDGAAALIYLVEYIGGEVVYRATKILATDRQACVPDPYQLQWPALISGVLVTECGAVAPMATHQPVCTIDVNKKL